MSGYWPIVVSGMISGCGILCSGTYLLRRAGGAGGARPWWAELDTAEGALKRTRRRHLGMAVVALLSVFFFVGVNFLDPRSNPAAYLAFWAVISLLLLWLCLLALSDILQTRHRWRVLQRDVHEELRQALEEAIGSTTGAAERGVNP